MAESSERGERGRERPTAGGNSSRGQGSVRSVRFNAQTVGNMRFDPAAIRQLFPRGPGWHTLGWHEHSTDALPG